MGNRIIEISSPASLRIASRQLIITREETDTLSIPVDDIAALILTNHRIFCSQAVLLACAEQKIVVVVCNGCYMPTSLLLPIDGSSLHSKTLSLQIERTPLLKASLWQQIVRHKIEAQAGLISSLGHESARLTALVSKVLPADTSNTEATAARCYWPLLFGNAFRRDPDASGVNTLLNYGYAIIRSALARAVVSAGLHPAIGIHHRNQGNSFCLIDDLMEPLRPFIDAKVLSIVASKQAASIDRETKERLIGVLQNNCTWRSQSTSLLQAMEYYAVEFRSCLESKQISLCAPRESYTIYNDSSQQAA